MQRLVDTSLLVVTAFREIVGSYKDYQTLIREALRDYIFRSTPNDMTSFDFSSLLWENVDAVPGTLLSWVYSVMAPGLFYFLVESPKFPLSFNQSFQIFNRLISHSRHKIESEIQQV
ncbi:MAG: hypothetical protein OXB88_07985, partial [Bacteriovoracales bacterium]|nr:hypothetical protein [Bacteriovoracales bacterium]